MSQLRLHMPLAAAVFVIILLAGASAVATTWDMSADWSTGTNPNGVWTYGYIDATAGTFTNYSPHPYQTSWYPGQSVWCVGTNISTHGDLAKVLSTGVVTASMTWVLDKPTVRWTSPISGTVRFWTTFTGLTSNGGFPKSNGTVKLNGVTVYSVGAANNYDIRYSGTITVSTGDIVDFSLAPNGTFQNLSIAVRISNDSTGTLSGTIRAGTAGNPPIASAIVKTPDGKFGTVTGPDGAYSIAIPVGTYSLVASASGYSFAQVDNLSVTSGGTTTIDFQLSGGTVSGVVTSAEAGSPPISGATVRTLGSPSFSATTGPDGSFTFPAMAGAYTLIVCAPGHNPQRAMATVTSGAATTANFSLRLDAGVGPVLTLPAPSDWGEPPSAVAPPGDTYAVRFADASGLPNAGAPVIGGWNETVKPDESFTMTGLRFTGRTGVDAGTDTTVWIWADSPSGGVLKQAKIWRVSPMTLTALMPSDIPLGMYLVWIENESGASAPVCINRATPAWIGPLGTTVQAGNIKRVFGKNVSAGHGTTTSYAYIQPSAGGSLISCPVTQVEPYAVWFAVPVGTANGSYKLFVHNGNGGIYGWSDPLDLTVQDDWARATNQISLAPNGTNDATAIQNAIDSLTAMPGGGTVMLATGDFIIKSVITLKSGVELRGAGMNSTRILGELSSSSATISIAGTNCALTDFAYRSIAGFAYPSSEVTNASGSSDAKFTRFKISSDVIWTTPDSVLAGSFNIPYRSEVDSCEAYRTVATSSRCWVHNSNLYGNFHGATEAAMGIADNNCVEYNYVATKDWPVNPANGSKNYLDWMTDYHQFWPVVWSFRFALAYCSYSYMGHQTSKDVAVQTNKGEMWLMHGMGCNWFGNVLASNGLTLTLRTDGLVDGQPMNIDNYSSGIDGGQTVQDGQTNSPSGTGPWNQLDGRWACVLAGSGFGEMRQIVSHTPTSITVDRPWRVQPDSSSKVMLTSTYRGNVIYQNDQNAFPVGYVQSTSGSSVAQVDGNGWFNSIEGNTSHRTNAAGCLYAQSGAPSYWNEFRNQASYDVNSGGYEYRPGNEGIGPSLVGNAFRDSSDDVIGSAGGVMFGYGGDGNIFEGITATSKLGIVMTVGGWSWHQLYPDGLTLFRNNSITTIDGPTSPAAATPVEVMTSDSTQWLMNNTYTNSTHPYVLDSGVGLYSTPVSMYKLVRFSGYSGYPIDDAMVPIANVGIQSTTWTATPSASWIHPAVFSGSTLAPESDMGRLVIAVDTTTLPAGRTWGSVDVTAGTKTVRIGVVVDLASGTPPDLLPVASFTTSAVAGTSPLTISFDGSGSYDPDGAITSYAWDFGDGATSTVLKPAHTYSAGSYTATLAVTDNGGVVKTARTAINVSPALTSLTISGSPTPPVDSGTPVTFTVASVGGYQVKYKFLVNSGSGYTTLRDWSSSNTCTWTPGSNGYYSIKCYARSSDSTRVYDIASQDLSYPVGILPTSGMTLWMKSDAGVTRDGSNLVSDWADQVTGSSKHLTQSNPSYKPLALDNALNGRPVVRFSGGSCGLSTAASVLTGSGGFTTFTVTRFNTITSNYQYIWWNGTDSPSGGYGDLINLFGKIRAGWGSNSFSSNAPTLALTGTWYTITSRYIAGTHEMWVNGTAAPTSAKTDSNLAAGFAAGNYAASNASQGFYGDIAEILLYNRKLTDTEKTGVESYLSARWNPPTPTAIDRLKDVKALGDGILVSISSAKVATSSSGSYSDGGIYISEADRTCGMKVTGAGSAAIGDNLTLTGTADTDQATGERVLRVSTATVGANTPLVSLGMANKTVTASGQLVRVWGKLTSIAATYITLDDGSGVPVKIEIDGLTTPIVTLPSVGQYISATGPAGYMAGGVTAVRVRSTADIQAY